jgi:hypothetical protein
MPSDDDSGDDCQHSLASFIHAYSVSFFALYSPCKCANFGVMETTWEIVKNDVGQFDIFRNGELHSTVNGSQLERQLAPHGIIESTYDDVCLQLYQEGRAKVTLPPLGKFFQIA